VDLADLGVAVENNDPAHLLRLIEWACKEADWEGILTLRERCYSAVERGKQLWGVAHHAEYRLALEAPGAYAGPMVDQDPSGFALGPLEEVAASTHTWDELEAYLPSGPSRALTAHERVMRGEDLTREPDIDRLVLEIPLALAAWEPRYRLATYHADRAEFPSPDLPLLEPVALPSPGRDVEDHETVDALRKLVEAWVEESNGRSEVAVVRGPAQAAIARLGLKEARMVPITPAEALAMMGWAAASGGAHGKRRGAASGRFAAWWAAAAVADLLDDWPPSEHDLGQAIEGIRWFAWSDLVEGTGWGLHLAANDPRRGRSWAITAVDAA